MPDIAVKVYCQACGGRGGVSVPCDDPQCGDSTWDHYCTAGFKRCEGCAAQPMRDRMARLQAIFAAILRERDYQDAEYGTIEEHGHEVGGWLTIMRRELLEAEDAWCSPCGNVGALQEILQVAALAMACLEQHGVWNARECDDA